MAASWAAHCPYFPSCFLSCLWLNSRRNYLQRSTVVIMKFISIHTRVVVIAVRIYVSCSYEYKILLNKLALF